MLIVVLRLHENPPDFDDILAFAAASPDRFTAHLARLHTSTLDPRKSRIQRSPHHPPAVQSPSGEDRAKYASASQGVNKSHNFGLRQSVSFSSLQYAFHR
jgi:hypothetical protein